MTLTTIAVELIQHADGRTIAYVDATAVAVFAYQEPDGTYVIDIYTRDAAARRMRLLFDSQHLLATTRHAHRSSRRPRPIRAHVGRPPGDDYLNAAPAKTAAR